MVADIATKYSADSDTMAGLHESVPDMMSAGSWTALPLKMSKLQLRSRLHRLKKTCPYQPFPEFNETAMLSSPQSETRADIGQRQY